MSFSPFGIYPKIHREIDERSNFQNGFAVLGFLGSQGSREKCLQFCLRIEKLEILYIYIASAQFWIETILMWVKNVDK